MANNIDKHMDVWSPALQHKGTSSLAFDEFLGARKSAWTSA
jgi:hypothetical protein